jgi:hypothetical protein
MSDIELEFYFEQKKRNILAKIQRIKDRWQDDWQESQGNLAAENNLIYLKMEMQVGETEALEELRLLEEKVKRASGGDLAGEKT